MEEGENRRKSDDTILEQRMELCKQFLAGIGINHKGKRIAQVETVNAEQGFGINGVSPGDQVHLIGIFGQQIYKILDLIDLPHSDL